MRATAGAWQHHREAWLLGGLMLILGAGIALEAMPPPAASTPAQAARPALPAVPGAGDGPALRDPASAERWIDTALGRPLFALDRRPAATADLPDGSLPRLCGTLRFGNTALALFDLGASGDPAHHLAPPPALGAGAQVGGWTIAAVSDERVVLTKGSETRTLRLAFSQAPPPPALVPKGAAALRLLHGKKTNVFWQP